jgi:heterodisulfide reductase subunit B
MKYSYFPGCNLKTDAKGFEETAIAVSQKLGAELVEMPEWNCCGTVHSLSKDNLMKRIAPVRDLARASKHAEELGNPNVVVTLCSMCNSTLKIVNKEVIEDKEKLEPINFQLEFDELEYKGNMEVKHFLEILREDVGYEAIANAVENPLKGMKICAYYGCMLLHGAPIDDEEAPTVMESIVQSLGAEVVDWPLFKYCCGSYHITDNPDLVNHQVERIIQGARQRGANAIVAACPLCTYNLDSQQLEMIKSGKLKQSEAIPIFYFTQLMAIALGIKPLKLNHFEEHLVDPQELLINLGFLGRKISK